MTRLIELLRGAFISCPLRLFELMRDAFTDCQMSRSQAWAEIWRQRAASLAEGEPRAAGDEGCESTGDDPSANSKLTWSTEDAD